MSQPLDHPTPTTPAPAAAVVDPGCAAALGLVPFMVVGVDRAGAIVLFNVEAERVSGIPAAEALGSRFFETLLSEGLPPTRHDGIARALDTLGGLPMVFEAKLLARGLARGDDVRTVRWHLGATGLEGPGQAAVVAVGQDISAEEARAARSREAERMAAIGTLTAGFAHEIRNPLHGAQLHLTFLERGLRKSAASAELVEAVEVVEEEIKRLSSLVDDFLEFARPKPLHKQRSVLQAACERAATTVASEAKLHGCTISLQMPSTPVEAHVDPEKIHQALVNLLQNAVEAMGPVGGGRVVVRLGRQPLQAILEVRDEGPGLSGSDAPVFDAFFTSKPNGTGLGLSIVQRIVTDHGGSISVDSRPGNTAFTLSLPLASRARITSRKSSGPSNPAPKGAS